MIQKIEYKDFNVFYRVEGNGETIVLIHGFCESMEIWDDFVKVLSQRYRVIIPDLPGHGMTGDPGQSGAAGELGNTMEMQAEAINEILKVCGVDRCTMVGHSMGGYTTLAFAELFSEKIKGFCLFHSTAMSDTEEKKLDRDRAIEAIEKDKNTFLDGLVPKMFAPSNVSKMKKEIDKVLSIAKGISETGLIAALYGMRNRIDRQHVLAEADYPVLFIIGKDDMLIPLDRMYSQIVKPGHSEVLILSGVGHMGFYEAPEKTLFAIGKFMEQI